MYRLLLLFILVFIVACHSSQQGRLAPKGVGKDPELDSLLMQGIDETSKLQPNEARQTLTLLLKKAEEQDSPEYELLAYNNLGRLYQLLNVQDMATDYYLKALDVAQKEELNVYLNTLYNNLGIIYMQNNALETARKYLNDALELSKEQGDSTRIGLNLSNLGPVLEKLGEDERAEEVYGEAVEIFEMYNDSINLSPVYFGLGDHFFKKNDFEKALAYYQKSYAISPRTERPWLRWAAELNMGRTYIELGEPDSALVYINSSIDGFQKSKDHAALITAYMAVAIVRESLRQYPEALTASRKAISLQDSVLVTKSSKWASELQLNYAFGRKSKQLEDLQTTSRRRQWLWAGGVAGVLLFGGLFLLSFRNANKVLKQNNVILEKEKEVNRLQLESKANEQRAMELKLEFKNRELAGKAIHLIGKTDANNRLRKLLAEGRESSPAQQKKSIEEALRALGAERNMEEEWDSFIHHFEAVHPAFFQRLKKRHIHLTPGDLRLSAYITMDFSAKEIARIFNISPESVRKRKQRLREKLELDKDGDLTAWLLQLRE